jgi:NAD-dependent SIR2 family protein deacetylase
VPFSHQLHNSSLGIDCRYCHVSVNQSSFANIPATETCMTCHSQIATNSPRLALVRESYATGQPIEWVKVHKVPDFVYFNHAIHVTKGVGCSNCHGQVNEMPVVWQTQAFYMGWCLDCHRNPEQYVRPRDQVYNMDYVAPANQLELGAQLVREYGIMPAAQLTNCWVCHR